MTKWTLDYTLSNTPRGIRDPPGHQHQSRITSKSNGAASSTTVNKHSPAQLDSLRRQKAWEVALGPAKNVPMQAFMMYMTGGGVQIFSVMSAWFLLKQAVQGLLSVDKAFAHFTTPATTSSSLSSPGNPSQPGGQSYFQQKAVYALCQLALLGVGLWKCHSMGLLPTHQSDWLAFQPRASWMDPQSPQQDVMGYSWASHV